MLVVCGFFSFLFFQILARDYSSKMPRILFISAEYWKQYRVKQPDAKETEIYSDSLAFFITVVNKYRLWLKVLRTLHLMLNFCLKCVPFETLVCSGEVTNLGWFVDCQVSHQQKHSLKKLCPEANTQTQTDKIYLFSILGHRWLAHSSCYCAVSL